MLVLSRKIGERIVINDNITLVVQRLSGNRVALGIEAPPEVPVVRGELQGKDVSLTRIPALATICFAPAADCVSDRPRRAAK